MKHTDELKGRIRSGIEGAGEQLLMNKEIARLDTDVELDIEPEKCLMAEWDEDAVRRLFLSLEFRTLLERLEDVRAAQAGAAAGVEQLDLVEGGPKELGEVLSHDGPVALRVESEGETLVGLAASAGEGRGVYAPLPAAGVDDFLADAARRKWVHDAKHLQAAVKRAGRDVR